MKVSNLLEIVFLFFKLGTTAFGGPAAHIAMMEEEVVRKRQWMTKDQFLDLIGATNMIPGPNSSEMAMHCGHQRGGVLGMILAGFFFIFPAVVLTSILAYFYHNYGQLPEVTSFIYGISPAVIAIIFVAGFSLYKKAAKNNLLIVLGVLALLAAVFGINEILLLFGGGIAMMLLGLFKDRNKPSFILLPFLALPGFAADFSSLNLKIFLLFAKVGAVLYGGGYVLFALLDAELVDTGLLSRQVLMDAIAVGQFTPGPVLSSATFIGWQMNGLSGAILATLGIFLPSFVFVAFLNPIIPHLRRYKAASLFLDGVNMVAVSLIFGVAVTMTIDVSGDWKKVVIALFSALVLFRYPKLNSMWIVLFGALSGFILQLFG